MAVLSRADLLNQINTLLPDNNTEEISPADLRSVLTDMLDSDYNLTDNIIQNIGGNLGNTNLSLTSNRTLNAGGVYSLTLGGSGGQELSSVFVNTLNPSGFNGASTTYQASGSGDIFLVSTGLGAINVDQQSFVNVSPGGIGFQYTPDINNGASFIAFGADAGGARIIDTFLSEGMSYDSNYFTGGWPLDNLRIPDAGAIKSHLGGQSLSAGAQSPTAGEDGYVLAWNNAFSEYELVAVSGGGTVISGLTDNFIPISNATGDNIENGYLENILVNANTDIELLYHLPDEDDGKFTIKGDSGFSLNNQLFFDVRPHNTNAFGEYTGRLDANGSYFEARRNSITGTVTTDYMRLQMPQSSIAKVDLYNFGGFDTSVNCTFLMAYGGVDYMGHTYGTNTHPRIVGGAGNQNYTWLSDNNQHVTIGFQNGNTNASGVMNNNNAHLQIYSQFDSPNPEPHLRFVGDYDTGANGAASNNSMYLDAADSKLHLKGSAGQDVILEDLGALPIIKKTGVSFNTSGVAGKSFINIIDSDVNVNSVINITLDAFINDLSILHIAAGAGSYTIYYDYVASVVNVPYNITII